VNADDRLTSRLLAGRDALSRSEKDAILAGLAVAAPRAHHRWIWLALPAIAVVALFVIAPWHVSPSSEFGARGNSRPVAALSVTCTGGCTRGGKLLFDLHGTTKYLYFAAFAKRGEGPVLWYFPTADDATSVAIAETGVLDRGIVLGPEHAAGTYRIYGVFSTTPLTRATIRATFDPVKLTAGDAAVVTSDLEIQ
jgi:hypothetical protein